MEHIRGKNHNTGKACATVAVARHAFSRVISIFAAALLALFLAISGTLPHATAQEVRRTATSATFSGNARATDIAFTFTSPVSYSVYVLPDPWRLVIDMPEVDFALPEHVPLPEGGLITGYRHGALDKGRSRIVIDMAVPALIRTANVEKFPDGTARIRVSIMASSEKQFRLTYRPGGRETAGDLPPLPAPEHTTGETVATQDPASARSGKPRIVIDPGHGGMDPGAVGVGKVLEKDIVLAFSQALRTALEQSGRYEVSLTREDDRFLSLRTRRDLARERKGDLFIAIHADILRGPSVRGATLYTVSDKASDAEADALAKKENNSDVIAGVSLGAENADVSDILIDLTLRETKGRSLNFAHAAVKHLRTSTLLTSHPLRSAGFAVLKAPDVPSVLLELGYLSNPDDVALLQSPDWQKATAASLAGAVDEYFATRVALEP